MNDHTENPEKSLSKSINYLIYSQLFIIVATAYTLKPIKAQVNIETILYYIFYFCIAAIVIYKVKSKKNWARLIMLFATPLWIITDAIGIMENIQRFFEGETRNIFIAPIIVYAAYYQIKGVLIISKNPVKQLFSSEKK